MPLAVTPLSTWNRCSRQSPTAGGMHTAGQRGDVHCGSYSRCVVPSAEGQSSLSGGNVRRCSPPWRSCRSALGRRTAALHQAGLPLGVAGAGVLRAVGPLVSECRELWRGLREGFPGPLAKRARQMASHRSPRELGISPLQEPHSPSQSTYGRGVGSSEAPRTRAHPATHCSPMGTAG